MPARCPGDTCHDLSGLEALPGRRTSPILLAILQREVLFRPSGIGGVEVLGLSLENGGSPYASSKAMLNASIAQSSGLPCSHSDLSSGVIFEINCIESAAGGLPSASTNYVSQKPCRLSRLLWSNPSTMTLAVATGIVIVAGVQGLVHIANEVQ